MRGERSACDAVGTLSLRGGVDATAPIGLDAGRRASPAVDDASSPAEGGAVDGGFVDDASTFDGGPIVCDAVPAPPVLPAPLVAKGARLVPRTVVEPVANGVEAPWSIRDTALDVDCEPLRYVDGKVRCVPRAEELVLLGDDAYADAAKTLPIVVAPIATPPAPGQLAARRFEVGTSASVSGCGYVELTSFSRVGAARAGTQYWSSRSGLTAVPAGYGMFDRAPVTPDFVEVTEVRTALSGPIALRELHGADGSRLFASDLWDTAHDVPVSIPYGAPSGRLLPPRVGTVGYRFTPPPGGVLSPAYCGAYDLVLTTFAVPSDCDVAAMRFVTGPGDATYQVVPHSSMLYWCATGGPDAPSQPPVLGQKVGAHLAVCASEPATAWSPVAQASAGKGRLTASGWSVAGAPAFQPFPWPGGPKLTDATLGVDCAPATAADGKLRCLPTWRGAVAYSDPACTSRVVVWNLGNPPAYAAQGTHAGLGFPPAALGTVTMYGVGAVRPAGPVYAVSAIGTCAAFDGWTSYEIGAQIPASTFAALELRDAP